MSKSVADRLIEGAQEALAVAKGEIPAASITVNGHRYVPAAELDRLRDELREGRKVGGLRERARKIGISPTTLSRFENGKEPDMKTARKIGPHIGTCPCCKQGWPATEAGK